MASFWAEGECLNKDVRVVLFDKDGTLIDIHHYWAKMIRMRASLIVSRWFSDHENALVDSMGMDLDTGKMKPDGPVGIKPRPFIVNVAADVVRSYGVSLSIECVEEMFAEVDAETSKNLGPLLRLLPGVVSLLIQLEKFEVDAIIVSTDITNRAEKAMEILRIDHLFSNIIGGDSVSNTKPAPDMAVLAMSAAGIPPDKAVVIGDHSVDIEMGVNAGIRSNIGVLTGLSSSDIFQSMECVTVPDLTSIELRE